MLSALIIISIALFGLFRSTDIYEAMIVGATRGLKTVLQIFPSLLVLLTAVYMLRASGFTDTLTIVIEPLFSKLGIAPELSVLMVLRPISGSGALAAAGDIIATHGVDSVTGRAAAIMMGSTETTFYVLAVYFGAVSIKKTRWAIPAALTADFVAMLTASICAKIL